MTQKLIKQRYEIHEMIGYGGMGNVYRGVDTQSDSVVAIKHLKYDVLFDTPDAIERFKREGDLLAELAHPNIVRIFDTVEEDDNHYIIMEYLSGGSLKDVLEQTGQLSIERVLEIALDLADALTRTHRLNIIHRDIKPANILIADDGTPRLTDFGIARSVNRTGNITTTGAIIGTFSYLSPEACEGKPLDHRTDIWAFGVLLFEMFTGQRPFVGGHEAAVLISILNEDAPNIYDFRPDVPNELSELISQMLIKDRDHRLSSIRYIGAKLENILNIVKGITSEVEVSRFQTNSKEMQIQVPFVQSGTKSKTTPPTNVSTSSHRYIGFGIGVIAVVAVIIGLFVIFSNNENSPAAQDNSIRIERRQSDKTFLVLVAQLEAINTQQSDPSGLITSDLILRAEQDVSSSDVEVQRYPAIIHSREEALEIALRNEAAVIIWGTYTDTSIDVTIQLGSLEPYKNLPITRDEIEDVTTVRVRLNNPQEQTILLPVMNTIIQIENAASQSFSYSLNLANLMNQDNLNTIEFQGNSNSVMINQAIYYLLIGDLATAQDQLNNQRVINANNPLVFLQQGLILYRAGDTRSAEIAFINARQSTSNEQEWVHPEAALGLAALQNQEYEAFKDQFEYMVTVTPEYWFFWDMLGVGNYMLGNFDDASTNFENSFQLLDDNAFPFPFYIMVQLREGQALEAIRLVQALQQSNPDPSSGYNVSVIAFGSADIVFVPRYLSAFINLTFGQFEQSIDDTEAALAIEPNLPSAYLMQGFAYCNLGEYANAETALTTGIELDNSFYFLNFLRAEARLRQGDLSGAAEDFEIVQNSPIANNMAPLLDLNNATGMQLSCENLFLADVEALIENSTNTD